MKFFQSLATVCAAALKESGKYPNAIVGVFKRADSQEYYFSYDANEVRVADEFVCQYIGGELIENNHPVS